MFKFEIGQMVRVDMSHKHRDWVWTGRVQQRACVDEPFVEADGNVHVFNEYLVENGPEIASEFPLLAWESELTAVENNNG